MFFCCIKREGDGLSQIFDIPIQTHTLSIGKTEKIPTIETNECSTEKDDTTVLVEVRYVSLSFKDGTDLINSDIAKFDTKKGLIDIEPPMLKVKIGHDFSGIVKKAGLSSGYEKGDAVYGWVEQGAFSDYIVVSGHQVSKLPKDFPLEVASCLGYCGWIAYNLHPQLKSGYKVYINAEGFLKHFLKTVVSQYTQTVYDKDDEEKLSGKDKMMDFYIEALNQLDSKGIIKSAQAGFYLCSKSSAQLKPLRYDIKPNEFTTINQMVNQYISKISKLSLDASQFITVDKWDEGFPQVLENLKAEKTGPYVFEINKSLFTFLTDKTRMSK